MARRTKPITSAPPVEQAATLVSVDRTGHGIAALAQQLDDLERLHSTMSEVEAATEREIEKVRETQCGTEKYSNLCRAHQLFERTEQAAYDKVEALQKIILALEPTTASETLSLALVFAGELHVFMCDNCNHDDHGVRTEMRKLERTLTAIIRGLVYGTKATSPLVGRYMHHNDLIPWEAVRSTATCEANPYRVEYDPVTGRLMTKEAVKTWEAS